MNKLVTIITPTYNHEGFIEECIRSVLAQSYTHWEMIIIDDGSTDGTGERVGAFSDDRIRYLRQENGGIANLSRIYNRALAMARGELVAILEGDDYWPPDKLKTQVGDFEDEEVVLSFGYTRELPADGSAGLRIPVQDLPAEALTNTPVGRASRYMMNLDILTMTFPVSVLIRKKALERIGGFLQPEYLPLVDYPTFLTLTLEGRFVFHGEVLGFWRRHGESVTRKNNYLIHEGVHRFLCQFLAENRERLPLDAAELGAIESQWKQYRWSVWFLLGRWFLVEGDWANARRAFTGAARFNNNWKQSLFLRLCIAFSHIHCHVEPLTSLLRLPRVERAVADMNRAELTISKDLLDSVAPST